MVACTAMLCSSILYGVNAGCGVYKLCTAPRVRWRESTRCSQDECGNTVNRREASKSGVVGE